MVYAIERILIMFSEPGFSRAALVIDPAVGVFDIIALDAESSGIGIAKGEGAGVSHVVSLRIVVCGGQLQAITPFTVVPLWTPVSQLPRPSKRAAQFYVLPVCIALLAVDGDEFTGLPLTHSLQCAVSQKRQPLEVTLCIASFLVVPCADYKRSILLVQLHSFFVRLWVGISWLVAAARSEGEGGNQEE